MNEEQAIRECTYKTSRSSGKGGQNVNKVETKVELIWCLPHSTAVTDEERARIALKLANNIDKEGCLHLTDESSRSQLDNKKTVESKFLKLLTQALVKPKPRKKTKPSKAAIEKRLQEKKMLSEKKKRREGF